MLVYTPQQWTEISKNSKLTWDFILQYHQQLTLEYILLNPNVKFTIKSKLIECFDSELDWTMIAFGMAYRLKNGSDNDADDTSYAMILPPSYLDNRLTLIDWRRIDSYSYKACLNNRFLKRYMHCLDWNSLIRHAESYIASSVIQKADAHGLLDWNYISTLPQYPPSFLTENQELIHWDVYFRTHDLSMLPKECWTPERVLMAVRYNPDNIHYLPDHGTYALSADFLRGKVWIDRIPDGQEHFADDSTIRNESLLEHKWIDRSPVHDLHYNDEHDYEVLQETDSDLFNESIKNEHDKQQIRRWEKGDASLETYTLDDEEFSL